MSEFLADYFAQASNSLRNLATAFLLPGLSECKDWYNQLFTINELNSAIAHTRQTAPGSDNYQILLLKKISETNPYTFADCL